jgi:hypothetical protein
MHSRMRSSHKTVLLLCISFLFASGADQYYLLEFGQPDITLLPHSLAVAICLFFWCKQHGKEHNKTNLKFYPLGCAFFGFIGVPVYAFRFFGFKSGVILLSKALLVLLLTVLASFGVSELVGLIFK